MHTVTTRRACGAAAAIQSMIRESFRAACTPWPPGKTRVSTGSLGSGSATVAKVNPVSVDTGCPSIDAMNGW